MGGCLSCAHTRDLAHNPGMCPDWESNQQPFASQAPAQSTEVHQLGHPSHFLLHNAKACHGVWVKGSGRKQKPALGIHSAGHKVLPLAQIHERPQQFTSGSSRASIFSSINWEKSFPFPDVGTKQRGSQMRRLM